MLGRERVTELGGIPPPSLLPVLSERTTELVMVIYKKMKPGGERARRRSLPPDGSQRADSKQVVSANSTHRGDSLGALGLPVR